jgi:hypothetical protein
MDIDLRWGATKGDTQNGKELDISLDEIVRQTRD